MKDDNFLIAIKCKKTIEFILKLIDNYPKKYSMWKDRITYTCFDLLESIYISNIDNSYKKYLIPKIKLLDYYLKLSFKYKIISDKKYDMAGRFLLELVKMIMGWNNEKS